MTTQEAPRRRRSKVAFVLAWLFFVVMLAAAAATYVGAKGVAGTDVTGIIGGFTPERDLLAQARVAEEAAFTEVELEPGEYSVMMMGDALVYEAVSETGTPLDGTSGLTAHLAAMPAFPPDLVVRPQGGDALPTRAPVHANLSRAGGTGSAAFVDFTVHAPGVYEFGSHGVSPYVQQVGIAAAEDYTVAGASSWFGDLMRNGGLVIGGVLGFMIAGLLWLITFLVWLFSGGRPAPQAQPQVVYVQASPPGSAPPEARS